MLTEITIDPRKIPVPEKNFDEFVLDFNSFHEVIKTKEWKEIYSNYFELNEYEMDIIINETPEEIEQYSQERQLEEIAKCHESFQYFAHKYVKIAHKMRGTIPFMMFKYQLRTLKEYESNRFNILSKFRQGGLTTLTVLWSLWRCMFRESQTILVVSKTDREAIGTGEIVNFALNYLPSWLKPEMVKDNDHEKQFAETDSTLLFHTVEAARSKSLTLMVIDEAAFIKDMDRHWKAIYPTISTGGACIVVSTVNGVGNWYEEIYTKGKNKNTLDGKKKEAGNTFNVIELDYWEHPEYNNPTWVAETRANIGEKGWQQEVLRSFLGSGQTFISSNIIHEYDIATKDNKPKRILFSKYANSGQDRYRSEQWDSGALWIWKEAQAGHEYIIGVDCAEGIGEDSDNSCFCVLDVGTTEQVAEFYSNRVQPNALSKILYEIGTVYNNALIVIERESQGVSVLNYLEHTLMYDNLYFDPNGKHDLPGLRTNKQSRPLYLEIAQNRLSSNALKINSSRLVDEIKTFMFDAKSHKAKAQRGRHDDAIFALCLALYVGDSQMRHLPPGAETTEKVMDVFKSVDYEEIKKEIQKDAPENWLKKEDVDPILEDDGDGEVFRFRRKHNKLLSEFGW